MIHIVPLITSLFSFTAVCMVYYQLLIIAKDKMMVDNPEARKLQKEPVPVLGGVAVYFGILVGVLAFSMFMGDVVNLRELISILVTTGIMLYIGAIDDMIGLRARMRLIVEFGIIAALIYGSGGCMDSFHGLWGIHGLFWPVAVALTIFASVGIINSINMIDGVNGLSSGLCILFCCVFGYIFFRLGDVGNSSLAFSAAAALLPFYINNVFGLKSRMFIGDAGTLVLGTLMSWFVISLLRSDSLAAARIESAGMSVAALVLAILCVPVADSIRVMLLRICKGKSPFNADRNHLHHVFISLGISHYCVSLIELLIAVIIMAVFYLSYRLGASIDVQLYVVVLSGLVLVWGPYFFFTGQIRKQTSFIKKIEEISVHTHLGRKPWWKAISAWLDKPEEKFNANRRKSDIKFD